MARSTATPLALPLRTDGLERRSSLSFRLSRQFFLRGLALVYLSAFLSVASQADGLIGRSGLLPVHEFLASRPDATPATLAWRYPTLLWLDDSDATIDAISLGGAMAATLVALGLLQMPMLATCFALYLSLTVGGQQFFEDTPWDSLLLEAGFLACFLAPWQLSLRPSRHAEPPAAVLWLTWWLLFRVLFGSGLVKLAWGDPAWRDGTAMKHYFLVQPLPVFSSWYAARLPAGVLSAATWGLLMAELVLPLAVLFGRWGRRLAFLPLAVVQVLILMTGNYGFLNYLVLVLCLLLLDDAAWHSAARAAAAPYRWAVRTDPVRRTRPRDREPAPPGLWRWPRSVQVLLLVLIIPVSLLQLVTRLPCRDSLPAAATAVLKGVEPLRVVNSYGVYGRMPVDRVEIVIEGSRDGIQWRPYEFRFKPGDITRAPGFVAPHMPRVDWLMWSLRSTDPKEEVWFQTLLRGLLEGRKQVVDLVGPSPFPENPAFLRVRAFNYRYATAEQRSEGYWWRREYLFDSIGAIWLRDRPPRRPGPATVPAAVPTSVRPPVPTPPLSTPPVAVSPIPVE